MGLVKPLVMSLQVGQPSRSGSEPALWGRLVQLCSLSGAPFLESKGFWSCQGRERWGQGLLENLRKGSLSCLLSPAPHTGCLWALKA